MSFILKLRSPSTSAMQSYNAFARVGAGESAGRCRGGGTRAATGGEGAGAEGSDSEAVDAADGGARMGFECTFGKGRGAVAGAGDDAGIFDRFSEEAAGVKDGVGVDVVDAVVETDDGTGMEGRFMELLGGGTVGFGGGTASAGGATTGFFGVSFVVAADAGVALLLSAAVVAAAAAVGGGGATRLGTAVADRGAEE